MKPEVSVIIPAYNAEKYIKGTVEAVLSQSFSDFELICVDDGSTDDTLTILNAMALTDPRIQVYAVENAGVSNARNIGIEKAQGAWLQFVDADDTIDAGMLEKMKELSDSADLVVCSVAREYLREDRQEYQRIQNGFRKDRKAIGDYLLALTDETKDVLLNYVWNKWFRREIIQENHIRFDTNIRLGEDFVFVCQYLACCKSMVATQEALYHYNVQTSGSLISRFDPNEASRRLKMREAMEALYSAFGVLSGGGMRRYSCLREDIAG